MHREVMETHPVRPDFDAGQRGVRGVVADIAADRVIHDDRDGDVDACDILVNHDNRHGLVDIGRGGIKHHRRQRRPQAHDVLSGLDIGEDVVALSVRMHRHMHVVVHVGIARRIVLGGAQFHDALGDGQVVGIHQRAGNAVAGVGAVRQDVHVFDHFVGNDGHCRGIGQRLVVLPQQAGLVGADWDVVDGVETAPAHMTCEAGQYGCGIVGIDQSDVIGHVVMMIVADDVAGDSSELRGRGSVENDVDAVSNGVLDDGELNRICHRQLVQAQNAGLVLAGQHVVQHVEAAVVRHRKQVGQR